ncbi:putative urea transporter 1-like [Penaeus vannamei]|uniref:Putative urea transporter 1-like n=1 Tax=Penaeus vannamei TaxID=6689 RepID=A0A3R7MFN2_PENVA|nr:putative urea transporter 1-like [Penaeus vannamei]
MYFEKLCPSRSTFRRHYATEHAQRRQPPGRPTPGVDGANGTAEVNVTQEIEWGKVFEGTLLASGQIYGVGTVDSSILVWLGFFLFSPLLTVFFYMGSVIGTMIGLLVSTAPYTDVYLGLWATMLCCQLEPLVFPGPSARCIRGCYCCSFSGRRSPGRNSAYIFSDSCSVFSYPFNVATLLLLAISTSDDPPFVWVGNKTFPEQHLVRYFSEEKRLQTDLRLSTSRAANGVN